MIFRNLSVHTAESKLFALSMGLDGFLERLQDTWPIVLWEWREQSSETPLNSFCLLYLFI